MRLTYEIPNGVDLLDAAVSIISATHPLVGTDAEAFGRQRDGRHLVILDVPDGAGRDSVVAAIRDETGYEPTPECVGDDVVP